MDSEHVFSSEVLRRSWTEADAPTNIAVRIHKLFLPSYRNCIK